MRNLTRPVPVSVRGALGTLIAVVVVGCSSGAAVAPTTSGPDVPVPPAAAPFPASDVLRAWDRSRSRAFAEGDVAGLRGLYAPGSAAGTADVRLLRDYLARGLRVEDMRVQLLAVEVLEHGRHRLRVRVTDRLHGAVAVGAGTRVPLPRDAASTRVVELVRPTAEARWRVSWVRQSGLTRAGR